MPKLKSPMLQLVMQSGSSYISIPARSMASWDKPSGSKPGAQKQGLGSCTHWRPRH